MGQRILDNIMPGEVMSTVIIRHKFLRMSPYIAMSQDLADGGTVDPKFPCNVTLASVGIVSLVYANIAFVER